MSPKVSTEYSYNCQNQMVKGENSDGSYSEYTYNALGARIENIQHRPNVNSNYANQELNNGSTHIKNYLPALSDERASWQPAWESEVSSVHQNDFESVTTHFTVDYLSEANRDIMTEVEGKYIARYVYDLEGIRVSSEFSYADGTVRGERNKRGEYGENPVSDIAVNDIKKAWYRTNLTGSSLYAIDKDGKTISHTIYDPWGEALSETKTDINYSGLEGINNYTGYFWDETLELYYAQNRFYEAGNHRFTQSDPIEDGVNWYSYVENDPLTSIDPYGYGVISGLKKTASKAKTAVSKTAKKVTNAAKKVGSTVKKAASTVKTTVKKTVTAVKSTATKAATAVKKTANTVTTAVKKAAVKTTTVVKKTAQTVKTTVVKTATAAKAATVKATATVKKAVTTTANKAVTAVKNVDWKAVGKAAVDTAIVVGAVALTAATFGAAAAVIVAGGAIAMTAYQTATSMMRGETVTAGDTIHNMAINATIGTAVTALYSNPVTATATTYALTTAGAASTAVTGIQLVKDISNKAPAGTIAADTADIALSAFATYQGAKSCMEVVKCKTTQAKRNKAIVRSESEGGKKTENLLENIQYTDKVKNQIKLGDYHSFPKSVDAFGADGKVTSIIGSDKITRTKIEIPGSYKGKEGVFQYIIEPDGVTCNHHLFVPIH